MSYKCNDAICGIFNLDFFIYAFAFVIHLFLHVFGSLLTGYNIPLRK